MQKEKIMRQLSGIASQLSNLRFNKIGSLFEKAGEYRIGKCLSPTFIFHDRETLGNAILQGPFEYDNDYYQALISVFLLHVQELRLQHNVFFTPIPILKDFETSRADVLQFVDGKILLRLVLRLTVAKTGWTIPP
jgi:hypothetical protein